MLRTANEDWDETKQRMRCKEPALRANAIADQTTIP